jgi:hypothetical protein
MADAEPLNYGHESPRKWVTVASFSHAAMANVAKLQLDAEDIPNYIDNEHSATMLWYIQPAVGGVRIKVPEEFEEQAREVLRDEDPDPEEQDEESYELREGEIAYANTTRCPKCHSTDTEPLSWGLRIVQSMVILCIGAFAIFHPFILVALGVYLAWFIYSKPSHRCLRCRHRFNAAAVDR